MANNDCIIIDEALINELRQYRDAYAALSHEARASLINIVYLRNNPASAEALSDFLWNLNPEQTTYGQVRELAKLYHATLDIPAAYQVLKGFEAGALNYSIPRSMTSLGTNMMTRINQFLQQEDKDNVQLASKAFFLHDDRKNRLGQALLSYVIKGNQDTVVAMLTRYPELLLYRGNVVDYSGREFKNVTALELTIWALDVRHMAPAMLKCLSKNEDGNDYRRALAGELQQQFDGVVKDDGGVNYTIGCGLLKMSRDPRTLWPEHLDIERNAELNEKLNRHDGLIQYKNMIFYFHNLKNPKKLVTMTHPDKIAALQRLINKPGRMLEVDTLQIINNDDELKTIQENVKDARHIFKEKHYDFAPLINALDEYAQSTAPALRIGRNQLWCTTVGLEQHYVPAHVAQHYCNPHTSFAEESLFDSLFVIPHRYTPPTFKEKAFKRILKTHSSCTPSWWPLSDDDSYIVLGIHYAIARAHRMEGAFPWVDSHMDREAKFDSAALKILCEVRQSEVPELQQLLDLLHQQDVELESAHCAMW